MNRVLASLLLCAGIAGETSGMTQTNEARFRLMTLNPGHFHSSLVQKFMYADIAPDVHVYAPAGDDLDQHLKRIERFNTRTNDPTHWREHIYTGPDFLEKMLAEKSGNIVVLAGNNAQKTDYILRSVQAGINVLADKPMAITPADFRQLQQAFMVAAQNKVLLYDIMTERYEITTMLQREFSQQPALFGEMAKGTPDDPAIIMSSVHSFSKIVAGAPLKRPAWFFDVRQEGEGIVDVATHLVDLVQWEAFPEQSLNAADAKVTSARRWATPMTQAQFQLVTGENNFPDYLKDDVKHGVLQVSANGEFIYRLRDIYAKVSVIWDFDPPPGGNDTHYSVVRGTKAKLIIRQGAEQNYKPVLYVEKIGDGDNKNFADALKNSAALIEQKYRGIGLQKEGEAWRVTIPAHYDVGHEAHFAQVTENYLGYLRAGKLPDWEVPNMLTKYATIMQAYEMSR